MHDLTVHSRQPLIHLIITTGVHYTVDVIGVLFSNEPLQWLNMCVYLPEPSGHDDSRGGGPEKEVAEQHRVMSEGAGWFVPRASTLSIRGNFNNKPRSQCSRFVAYIHLYMFVLC